MGADSEHGKVNYFAISLWNEFVFFGFDRNDWQLKEEESEQNGNTTKWVDSKVQTRAWEDLKQRKPHPCPSHLLLLPSTTVSALRLFLLLF